MVWKVVKPYSFKPKQLMYLLMIDDLLTTIWLRGNSANPQRQYQVLTRSQPGPMLLLMNMHVYPIQSRYFWTVPVLSTMRVSGLIPGFAGKTAKIRYVAFISAKTLKMLQLSWKANRVHTCRKPSIRLIFNWWSRLFYSKVRRGVLYITTSWEGLWLTGPGSDCSWGI